MPLVYSESPGGTIGSWQRQLPPARCSPTLNGSRPSSATSLRRSNSAAKLEVERRLRLGLPVVVDRGNGIEELTV